MCAVLKFLPRSIHILRLCRTAQRTFGPLPRDTIREEHCILPVIPPLFSLHAITPFTRCRIYDPANRVNKPPNLLLRSILLLIDLRFCTPASPFNRFSILRRECHFGRVHAYTMNCQFAISPAAVRCGAARRATLGVAMKKFSKRARNC